MELKKGFIKSQELTQQIEENIKDLAINTDKYKQTEFFKNYLNTVSKFYNYSLFNQLLILRQNPDAERVAGFRIWKGLNRYVKKGEHGIRILAPRFKKLKDLETNKEDNKLTGFLSVAVFDIKQTDGEQLPNISIDILGSDYKQFLGTLKDFCISKDIKINFKDIGVNGVYGYCKNKDITISDTKSINNQFLTLIHETAHSLINHSSKTELTKQQKEIQAEGVAYCVSKHFNLENKSIDYLALYDADYKKILENLTVISKTSKEIIKYLEDKMEVKK